MRLRILIYVAVALFFLRFPLGAGLGLMVRNAMGPEKINPAAIAARQASPKCPLCNRAKISYEGGASSPAFWSCHLCDITSNRAEFVRIKNDKEFARLLRRECRKRKDHWYPPTRYANMTVSEINMELFFARKRMERR